MAFLFPFEIANFIVLYLQARIELIPYTLCLLLQLVLQYQLIYIH